MKRTALALSLILLASIMAGMQNVEVANANFKPYKPPEITIFSPSSNEIYNSSSVSLNVKIVTFGGYPWYHDITSLNYSLDGQQDVPISFAKGEGYLFHGNATLSILSNGLHSISLYGESIYSSVVSDKITHFNATASFTVDAPDTAFASLTPAPEPQLEPFPTTLVIAASLKIAVVCIGSIVYIKKHKSEAKTPSH